MNIESKEIRAALIISKVVQFTGIITLAPTALAAILLLLHYLHVSPRWLALIIEPLFWAIPFLIGVDILVPSALFFWGALGEEDAIRKLRFGGRAFLLMAPAPIVLFAFISSPIPQGLVWLSPGIAGVSLLVYGIWLGRKQAL